MNRKYAELILTTLGAAEVVATFYTIYPPIGIALFPLVIYCLLSIYIGKEKDSNRNQSKV